MKRYADKCIVVTGGAGFIGSNVVRVLNEQGISNIVIVDNLGSTEKWKNLVGKNYKDLLHKSQLFSWLEGKEGDIGAFIHLGACTNTVELDANYLLENNFHYTQRLAEYALMSNIRFVYASSASTYGDGSDGFSDSVDDLEIFKPLNMYGYSKHMFDLWAKRQGVLNKIVGLKYFNVFGPNEYHKGRMASAIVRMVPELKSKGFISLFKSDQPDRFKDGEQKRDFIYVQDAAKMTCAFLENTAGGIFNIGTGKAASWNELASSVCSSLGKALSISYIDMPPDLKGKYQSFTEADMKKTAKALGAHFHSTPLQEAVSNYVQNFLVKDLRW